MIEFLTHALDVATSGFWQFLGVACFLTIFVNAIVRVVESFFNMILNFFKKEEVANVDG